MDTARILIVDDDEQVLSIFERILAKEGFDVDAVDNGSDALKLLEKNEYDLILTDLVMKGVDGFEIIEAVKEHSPQTVVILITGYGSVEVAIKALRKGAIDILIKPCTEDELLFRINNALERQKLGQKARDTEIYQKMYETLGAVAHEINNPLTTLTGNTQLLTDTLDKGHPGHKYVDLINISADDISKIIDEMRNIRGIVTKQYTRDSKIIDLQKGEPGLSPTEESTILIVDDEESITLSIARFLELHQYTVDVANSGPEALEKIKSRNFAVVILDICMPEMDGYEVLQEINKYYGKNNIRLPATIIMTGFDVEDVLDKCKEAGAFTAIHKPFKFKEFMSLISEAEDYVKK
ncbi:MAG: response regulator [bacterium]|nr:response regulator [bacterium]